MKRRRGVLIFFSIWWFTPYSCSFYTSRQPQRARSCTKPYLLVPSTILSQPSTIRSHAGSDNSVGKQNDLEYVTDKLLETDTIGTWAPEKFQELLHTMGAWSRRPNRRTCNILERLLRRVVEEKLAGNPNASEVNMTSMYRTIIEAWAKSGEKGSAQRAEEILDNMQSAYEDGDLSLKPDIRLFNAVLDAYAQSKQNSAPQQATRVLQKLYDLIAEGKTDIKPNKESYASLLRACASVGGKDAPLQVHQLLTRMEELSNEGFLTVRPDSKCHNIYLSSLLGSIAREDISGPDTARKADKYLQEMMASPYEDARPDTWSFNIVISIWSKSGDPEMAERAEALLAQLCEYHEASNETTATGPNTNTFNCVIACYSRSTLPDKAERAHALLEKMKVMEEEGMRIRRPDTVTYNSVMNAYAKSQQPDAPFKVEKLLREMHQKYEETGDKFLRPSSRSFNTCVSLPCMFYHWLVVADKKLNNCCHNSAIAG